MNLTFTDYENAVLQTLSVLAVANGGQVKTLKGFAGEVMVTEAGIEYMGLFPGILVEIAGATYDPPTPSGRGKIRETASVVMHVAARSWRDQVEVRTGESIGAYSILASIRDVLNGKYIGLKGVFPLEAVSTVRVAASPQIVIYRAEYRIINPNIEIV